LEKHKLKLIVFWVLDILNFKYKIKMKNKILIMLFSLLSATFLFAQENKESKIPLIGDEAPSFTAESTNGTIHFPKDYGKSWKILFSHPLDFTPVCTSELLEMAYMQDEFDKLGVKLVVVSTDDLERHTNWKKSMESLSYKNREPVTIKFPLVDDKSRVVAKEYGMIHPNSNSTIDVRGVFIIDPDNKVRSILFNPMQVGRNIDEIKRMVIALQATDKDVVLTPANWKPGDDVLIPYVKAGDEGSSKVTSSADPNLYQVAWYMTFKKMN
jgi:peroxiredoxin (alkyl hydroperoxide reductase subunit C)